MLTEAHHPRTKPRHDKHLISRQKKLQRNAARGSPLQQLPKNPHTAYTNKLHADL